MVVHSKGKGAEELAGLGSDCGFLVPLAFEPYITLETHHQYWSGLLLYNMIFLSAHFLELNIEEGKAAVVVEESLEFVQHCRRQHGGNLHVVAGFDANVTLPKNIEGVTGSSVLPPLKNHSRQMAHTIVTWCKALGIKILNTYGPDVERE
eukprot:8222991-Karenia_brevis.AAC.1